jgi:hypothetical protein
MLLSPWRKTVIANTTVQRKKSNFKAQFTQKKKKKKLENPPKRVVFWVTQKRHKKTLLFCFLFFTDFDWKLALFDEKSPRKLVEKKLVSQKMKKLRR